MLTINACEGNTVFMVLAVHENLLSQIFMKIYYLARI